MARYNPNHEPTGDAAKAADLPDGFKIVTAIRRGDTRYGPGKEADYAATEPSVADVNRLLRTGALAYPSTAGAEPKAEPKAKAKAEAKAEAKPSKK